MKLEEVIRSLSTPLEAKPPEVEIKLAELPGIRSVVFDVYGTLIISASGDISPSLEKGEIPSLAAALESARVGRETGAIELAKRSKELLDEEMRKEHQKLRKQGVDYPEVEIREIWLAVFQELAKESYIQELPSSNEIELLSVEYECRINPVWPMPGASKTLSRLAEKGYILGIVSNAQFYTQQLFPALFSKKLSDLGFKEELCTWSYEERVAKPSSRLYEILRAKLEEEYSLKAQEVLYVGNDMLKDIYPAH